MRQIQYKHITKKLKGEEVPRRASVYFEFRQGKANCSLVVAFVLRMGWKIVRQQKMEAIVL